VVWLEGEAERAVGRTHCGHFPFIGLCASTSALRSRRPTSNEIPDALRNRAVSPALTLRTRRMALRLLSIVRSTGECQMTTPQAVLAGFAMMTATTLLFAGAGTPQAQMQMPQFAFASQSSDQASIAWRLNVATGAISYCMTHHLQNAPTCSPWSK
jgi:hypothetical protein